VEVKATEVLAPTAKRQLLNYLRATTLDVGLLLHFGPDAKFHRLVSHDCWQCSTSSNARPFPLVSGRFRSSRCSNSGRSGNGRDRHGHGRVDH
jgi:hypothetical protein